LTHFLGPIHLPDLARMNTQMVTWEGLFMVQHRFQIRLLSSFPGGVELMNVLLSLDSQHIGQAFH